MVVSEAEPPVHPEHCRACHTVLVGLYCHACGQGHRHGRLSVRALFEGFIESLFELDSRALRTFWGLTIAPGQVVRDFLDGRRIVYVNPFKYAVIAVTIAFVAIPWVAELTAGPRPEAVASLVELSKYLNFAAMPLMALILRGLYWRHPLRWIEYFVLILLVLGHVFLIQTVTNAILLPIGPDVATLTGVIPVIWVGWALHVVTGSGWISSLVRAVVMLVVVQAVSLGVVWLIKPDLFG